MSEDLARSIISKIVNELKILCPYCNKTFQHIPDTKKIEYDSRTIPSLKSCLFCSSYYYILRHYHDLEIIWCDKIKVGNDLMLSNETIYLYAYNNVTNIEHYRDYDIYRRHIRFFEW